MAAFDFAKVKDPHLFFQGKRAECSCKFPYLRFPRRISDRLLFFALKLDGIWKFAYAKNYTSAIPGFEKDRLRLQRLG